MDDFKKITLERAILRRQFSNSVDKLKNVMRKETLDIEDIDRLLKLLEDKVNRLFICDQKVNGVIYSAISDESEIRNIRNVCNIGEDVNESLVSDRTSSLYYINHKFKLSKLELKRFAGDLRKWVQKYNKGLSLLDILNDNYHLENNSLNEHWNGYQKDDIKRDSQIKFLKKLSTFCCTESESLLHITSSASTVVLTNSLYSLDNINGLQSNKNTSESTQTDVCQSTCTNYLDHQNDRESQQMEVVSPETNSKLHEHGDNKQIYSTLLLTDQIPKLTTEQTNSEIDCNTSMLKTVNPLVSRWDQHSFLKKLISKWKNGKHIVQSVKDKIVDMPFFLWKDDSEIMENSMTCGAIFETLKEYSEDECNPPPRSKSKRVGKRTADQSTNYREKKYNRRYSHSKCESSLEIDLKDVYCQFDKESFITKYPKTAHKAIKKVKFKNRDTQTSRILCLRNSLYYGSSSVSLANQSSTQSNFEFEQSGYRRYPKSKHGYDNILKKFYFVKRNTQKICFSPTSIPRDFNECSSNSTIPYNFFLHQKNQKESKFRKQKNIIVVTEINFNKLLNCDRNQELSCFGSSDSLFKSIKSNSKQNSSLYASSNLSPHLYEQTQFPIQNIHIEAAENHDEKLTKLQHNINATLEELYDIVSKTNKLNYSLFHSCNQSDNKYSLLMDLKNNITSVVQKLCGNGVSPPQTLAQQPPVLSCYSGQPSIDHPKMQVSLNQELLPADKQKQIGNLEQDIKTVIENLYLIAAKIQENHSNYTNVQTNCNNIYSGAPSF
ncbi:hypothetical protein FQR65_LT09137 [Abscondita terminalis]|nr:hypothetical protein FQR65_LT09137 [Abscondita terminalis]